jgi:hypothetical protein
MNDEKAGQFMKQGKQQEGRVLALSFGRVVSSRDSGKSGGTDVRVEAVSAPGLRRKEEWLQLVVTFQVNCIEVR